MPGGLAEAKSHDAQPVAGHGLQKHLPHAYSYLIMRCLRAWSFA